MERKMKILFACLVCFLLSQAIFSEEAENQNLASPVNTESAESDERKSSMGVDFAFDISPSLALRPYIAQEVAYKFVHKNGVGFHAGFRVMENLARTLREPYLYIYQISELNVKAWYLQTGAGVAVLDQNAYKTESSNAIEVPFVFTFSTGAKFGNWKWGRGIANLKIGLDFSPTINIPDSTASSAAQALGSVVAASLLVIFDTPKLNVGLSYYLPALTW